MSYQIKRIDPYWHSHPIVPVLVVAGAAVAAAGFRANKISLEVVGVVLVAVAVLFATRVAISLVLASLGLFGGLVTFIVLPNRDLAGMSLGLKLLASGVFAFLYMVLMDALVLGVAWLYNLFSVASGGLSLDLEETGGDQP